jgi:Glu-tRNA(Gln) amidotransferase subunit E-like FAD-binding protein
LYNIIFDIPKDIKKRDKIEPIDFKFSLFEDLMKTAKEDNLNQKIIRDIFVSLYKDKLDEVSNMKKYLEENGIVSETIDTKEVEEKIRAIVKKNKGAPFGALMGMAMKEFGGKIDGKIISAVLRKLL